MYTKYPRTFHLPWSLGVSSDDKVMESVSSFEGKRVIVTEKMDGENTTMYRDYCHARSMDSISHETRTWVMWFWSTIRHDIPEGYRVCGENLYAKHSIEYTELPSFFLGFSVWNDQNQCLSWDDTQEWFALLGVQSVPVLFDGIYCEETIKRLWDEKSEGYVIRLAESFDYDDFSTSVGKFVRAGHVNQDSKHWLYGRRTFEQNQLKV